jgi:hypothetical protein
VIYFAQPVDGGPIKIGHAVDVKRRVVALQSWYGRRLAILAEIEGDRKLEAALHKKFDHLRLGTTEQFRPEPELLDYIGHTPKKPVDAASVVAMGRASRDPEEEAKLIKKRSGRPRDPDGAKTGRYAMRGSNEWHAWLKKISGNISVDRSVIIRRAVKLWAKQEKFEPPPEE